MSYAFDGPFLILCSVAGFPDSDLQTVLKTALADPERPTLRGTLYDVRASATFATRTIRELEAAASCLSSVAATLGRIALLASTDISYGLLRIIRGRTGTDAVEIEVFRDEGRAVRWLEEGLPQPPTPPGAPNGARLARRER